LKTEEIKIIKNYFNMIVSDLENLANSMAKKRICYNNDLWKSNRKKVQNVYCHAAVLFRGNPKRGCDIMTYGINMQVNIPYNRTIHAEADAIQRLPLIRGFKKLQPIHICVIKTTKTGKLGNSKPCVHCIQQMINTAPKKGYKIEWIYYSKNDGNIEKCKLSKFMETQILFMSSYYKHQLGLDRNGSIVVS
jgi:cytidine deaminase